MKPRLLVIDDDPGLLTLLRLGLEQEGFQITTASDGKEGLRKAYEIRPDVIILDVMMAEMDGWTTCQRLRQVCDTPIIMLTASAGESDVVKGLVLGADDYLTKPCSFDELKIRIHAILRRERRAPRTDAYAVYDDANLRIDLRSGTVTRRGQAVALTPTELRLLMSLVSRRGHVVGHEELLTSVWGPEYAKDIGYLSVYIRYLRQKIEDDPASPRYIRTRWKVGYYFAGKDAV